MGLWEVHRGWALLRLYLNINIYFIILINVNIISKYTDNIFIVKNILLYKNIKFTPNF